jgi:hypothetical protein
MSVTVAIKRTISFKSLIYFGRLQRPKLAAVRLFVAISGTTRQLDCPELPHIVLCYILYVPPIPQQIQISVDQPYAGPAASCCVISGTHSI